MNVPFHPIIVHFPLALTFVLPILILIFALMIKKNKMSHQAWLVIIGLQVLTSVTGYIALESGEEAEEVAERVVNKNVIHEHEERAEVFVGSTVIALVISVAAFFLRKEIQFLVKLTVCLVSLVSCFFAYRTGESGGELVYRYGAASAYTQEFELTGQDGILPTPGQRTSDSSASSEENESLKKDDNDYGKSDENEVLEDEDSKLED
jgi:uncharacterized membrane protein